MRSIFLSQVGFRPPSSQEIKSATVDCRFEPSSRTPHHTVTTATPLSQYVRHQGDQAAFGDRPGDVRADAERVQAPDRRPRAHRIRGETQIARSIRQTSVPAGPAGAQAAALAAAAAFADGGACFSQNFTSTAVMECLGSCFTNKYSEGAPPAATLTLRCVRRGADG